MPLFAVLLASILATAAPAAPPTVEELLADLPFHDDQRRRILGGELIGTTTEETSDRELAAGMAFIMKDPIPEIVDT